MISEFFGPALAAAGQYDRGVGYFTSNWLRLASSGLATFAQNAGRARFVMTPHMELEDWAALNKGDQAKTDRLLYENLRRVVEDLPYALEARTLSALSWMVADGLLDIRIALPRGDLDGDFHDKFGIFTDQCGNSIAFHGSQNDSAKAFRNYESISVFYSWVDDREALRVCEHQKRFENLWNNRDPNVQVLKLPEAIRWNLVQVRNNTERPYKTHKPVAATEPTKDKWNHQSKALVKFLSVGNGVLEMATGTGKTRTAFNILNELRSCGQICAVVVTMSGNDLLDQWYKTALANSDLALFRYHGKKKEASQYLTCRIPKALLIAREQLKNVLPYLPESEVRKSLLICDEVHGMGSPSMIRDLSGQLARFGFRLGLSATPEREYDEAGNEFVTNEIGPVIFKFSLEDAIKKGILCGFDYTALSYTLSQDDKVDIRQLIKRHHAKRSSGEIISDEALYRDIARVRKTTREKIGPFKEFLKNQPNRIKRGLLFVETAKFGREIQSLLLKANIPYHTYFQMDDSESLVRFLEGKLDCLISCHRLSEGIDIPTVQNIVIFSSSRAKLETIQRLGRCLRADPENPNKRAHLLDFVDFSDQDSSVNNMTADIDRYNWLKELSEISST